MVVELQNAVIPLLRRSINGPITVVAAGGHALNAAKDQYNCKIERFLLTKDNFSKQLSPIIKPGDLCINLASQISSTNIFNIV